MEIEGRTTDDAIDDVVAAAAGTGELAGLLNEQDETSGIAALLTACTTLLYRAAGTLNETTEATFKNTEARIIQALGLGKKREG